MNGQRPLAIALGISLLFVPAAQAAVKSAADLLPETTVAYAEISQPKELLGLVLDHPLRKQLESLSDFQQALQRQEYLQFKAVVSVIEAKLGMKWRPAVEAVTAGGIYLAVDAETEGVALLIQSSDQETLEKIRNTLLQLVRDDARQKGKPDPVESAEYRGFTAYKAGEARLATFDRWLVVTNQSQLGKRILDAYVDGNPNSFATQEAFQAAREQLAGKPTAWAMVQLERLREAGVAKQLFAGRTDNPAAELLVGGIVSNLQKTPQVTASLYVTPSQSRLVLSTPHDPSWVEQPREFFFGPAGAGTAPELLQLENSVLSVSTYRNVSQLWLRSGDLFDENMNDQLAQADSNLTTLFSGRDFGEEILGAIQPEIQLVVTRQQFEDITPQPAIKLPAFALVARLREPDKMRGEFRRTFQSLIGFLNVVGAMNAQPQLDLDMQTHQGAQVVTSTYVPEEDEKDSRKARINYNFSPSVAFLGDRMIVSSTSQLARQVVALTAKADEVREAAAGVNTAVRANLATLRTILQDNRDQLITQNMLEEGHEREEAEKEISTLLAIINVFRDASLQLKADANTMQLEIEVNLAQQP